MSLFSKLFGGGRGITYDPSVSEPVIHKSICTGETTVGFVDIATGKYHDLRMVDSESDIVKFCRECGVDREKIRTIF
ncbi:hypothetical protein SAMN02910456_01957 [Ruminococcaceae bacterium YRB3002]|nr:hypothetical protein SAMN02910456_01957 [Ruminococcaceae bacterium YRB3002]